MRSLAITLFLVSMIFARSAGAQTLEVQLRHNEDWNTAYDAYADTNFGDSDFGAQAFGLISRGWAEIVVGPTYAPIPQLELSVMVGAQTTNLTDFEPRYAASVWGGHGRFSSLAWVEFDHNGADGVWYDVTAKYRALDWFSAGLRARRYFGIGPTAWMSIPKTPFGVWLSWTPVGFEEPTDPTRAVGGITFTF